MSFIVEASSFGFARCGGEWLARTRPRPHFEIVGKARESKSVVPNRNSGEEMCARHIAKIARANIANASRIDTALGDVPGRDQVLKPLDRERFDLVVERTQRRSV